MACYKVLGGPGWQLEFYKTADREATQRAQQLRQLGKFIVHTKYMGRMLTRFGFVPMTRVHIIACTNDEIPLPEELDYIGLDV